MGYADDVPLGQGLDGISGFRLKVHGSPHRSNFLSFGHPTVFRVLPEIVDGQERPWRNSTGEGDFSGWIKGVRMAAKIGVLDKFTCMATPKGRPSREEGPIDFFHRAIKEAVENDPRAYPEDWKDWLTYKKGVGVKLYNPEYYALLQGALYEHGGKQFVNKTTRQYEPQFPALLALKTSARMSLENLCNVESPKWSGRADDWDTRYMIGDIFSLAKGSVIRIVPVPDDGRTRAHYDVENMGVSVPFPLEMAKNAYWPWDKLLDYLTEEEMVRNLERCFPHSAVDFALGKSPFADLMGKQVRGEFSRLMVKNAVPGFTAPGPQAGQTPPQWNPPVAPLPAMNVPSFTPEGAKGDIPKPPVIAGVGFAPPGASHMRPDEGPSFGMGGLSQPARVSLPASPGSLPVQSVAQPAAAPVVEQVVPQAAPPAPLPASPPATSQPVMGSLQGGDRQSVADRLKAMHKSIGLK